MVDPEFKFITLTANSALFLLLHSASWRGKRHPPGSCSEVQFLLAHIYSILRSRCYGYKYILLLGVKFVVTSPE